MKRVAILTINDYGNFGNRLQNYATQEVLKKYNLKVETINNQKGIYGFNYIKSKIKNVIKLIIYKKAKLANRRRIVYFIKFNQKNIKYSKIAIDKDHIPNNLAKKYDIFFTGSDQVWNPNFGKMSDIDFLTFAPKEKRKSFSASFGISEIPENMKEYYKNNLLGLNNISVREEAGKKIVEELTGRKDAEVLVDPTMLLTSEEWDKISKKPKQLRTNRYILSYFLGEVSEDRKKEIDRIAKKNGCEVINILDANDPFYETGPSEFLYLEKNAFLICTDSFHSCVFAIIYNRPFIVFDREDKEVCMNSRIETLLNKFKLQDRKFSGKITEEKLKHNYENAYRILQNEKRKANDFLKKALDMNDVNDERMII